MIILPDTKDLIELVEHARPLGLESFTTWLQERDARLALTFTNVREFSDVLRETHDILYVRSILQKLESLPAVFLREATISVEEISESIRAFEEKREPRMHSPFVPRWDYTFAKWGERPPAQMMVGYRLDLMVFDLSGPDPRRVARKREALSAIKKDRATPRAERLSPRESMKHALENIVTFSGLTPPSKGIESLAKWVYANPNRCPGFRLGWELFHELVRNETDRLQESDVEDHAHFPAIPYVDYATMDRRMTGYIKNIARRLVRRDTGLDYSCRVFKSLSELMNAVD